MHKLIWVSELAHDLASWLALLGMLAISATGFWRLLSWISMLGT